MMGKKYGVALDVVVWVTGEIMKLHLVVLVRMEVRRATLKLKGG